MSEIIKYLRLNEAYSRTETNFIKDFLIALSTLPVQDVSNLYNIPITVLDTNEPIFNGGFDMRQQKIIFEISSRILSLLKGISNNDDKIFNQLAGVAAGIYTHEDTHRQQAKKYQKIYHNYVRLSRKDFDTIENALQEVAYFNQTIEADAYGRRVAADLKINYPDISKDDLFALIQDNQIETGSQFFIDLYRDPLIAETSRRKFFRALYDEIYEKF